jgi:flavin reductase (DIM6/NTAB) family NADH-FMN oxidoreductase RutF
MNTSEQKHLREALGTFATGVTIVTTVGDGGQRIGLTANSFTSVSIDPPLVLWSLSKRSANLDSFRGASHFAVNVLSSAQQALCMRFAQRSETDRFDGVPLEASELGLPVLQDALASFECAKHDEYEAGDHVVFIGRIENYRKGDGEALIFNAGRLMPAPAAA